MKKAELPQAKLEMPHRAHKDDCCQKKKMRDVSGAHTPGTSVGGSEWFQDMRITDANAPPLRLMPRCPV